MVATKQTTLFQETIKKNNSITKTFERFNSKIFTICKYYFYRFKKLFLANSIDYEDLLQVCRLLTHEIINKKPNLNEEELKKYISTSLYRLVRKIGYRCKKEYNKVFNESSMSFNIGLNNLETDSILDRFNFYCGNSKKDDEIKKIEFKDLINFDKLDEKEKLVLDRYIYHNNTFDEIGLMVGLTRRGTSYLYERAMKKVRDEYFKNL